MRQHAGRTAGFTLPEMLTAIVVFGLIIGAVSGIYMSSLQSWALGITENYAQQKASWAVQRMAPDVRLGMRIAPGDAPFQSNKVAIYQPYRVFDSTQQTHLNQVTLQQDPKTGNYIPALSPGQTVVYYRGDKDGNLTLTGDRIWRTVLAADGVTQLKADVIADHVIDNPPDDTGNPKPLFVYWPDWWHLSAVEMTITVQERQGQRTNTATMTAEYALRNNL